MVKRYAIGAADFDFTPYCISTHTRIYSVDIGFHHHFPVGTRKPILTAYRRMPVDLDKHVEFTYAFNFDYRVVDFR